MPALVRQSASGEKLLVDADDAVALRQLAALGAERLADYGAFSLWRVPAASAAVLASRPSVTPRPDFDTIPLRGAVIDTRPGAAPPSVAAALRQAPTSGLQFWLVQFVGPIQDEWLKHLASLGLEVVSYLPHNAYVVWGSGASLAALNEWAAKDPLVQWTGPYHPAYRLAPSLQATAATAAPEQWVEVTVQFYTTGNVAASLARLRALGGQVRKAPEQILTFTNSTLQLPAGQLIAIAGWADVFNVEPWTAPVRLDEVQDMIIAGRVTSILGSVVPIAPGYLAWLATTGFTTTASAYPIVDVVDDGIDNGSTNPLHPDFHVLGVLTATSRLIYNGDCTVDPAADGEGGHGNLNAGIVGAYNNLAGSPHVDANGYRLGLGVSPYGRLGGTKIFNNTGFYDVSGCGGTDQGVVLASYNAGAAFTSNSWGAPVGGAYDSSSQAYDALTRDAAGGVAGNQQMLHIFAAGNDGPGANTVGSPGTAKNVLTVGATENVRDHGITDGCGFNDADDADDLAVFSSRGPTDDSRVKPDLMAPGLHVQGPASQDAGFNGEGVCGGSPNPPNFYYPAGQTLYTWSSGTSHSTPAVAGAASLAYEYYGRVLAPGQTPSPAMLKALLLNSPRYLNGNNTGGTLPSNTQGWGDVNLGTLFDGSPRALLDQALVLPATGSAYSMTGQVVSSTLPFRVSLVWTDAPGPTTGTAYVNDLNLQVTVGGIVYKGNVFSGANSTTGGSFDPRNNVENVFVPAGVSGAFAIEVIAANVAGDGVPGNGDATDQDFALVVSNGVQTPQAVLGIDAVSISDAAGDNDGVVEPGETIALDVIVTNAGTLTATGVTGLLNLTAGSASLLDPASTYPNLAPGATAANTSPYQAAVSSLQPCGQPLSFDLTATYNVSHTLDYSFAVPIGAPFVALSEAFDGVAAPALPAGWAGTVLSGTVTAWRTVTTTVDTAPNAAFASDVNTITDNVLVSPPFAVTTAAAQLSFRNNYSLENGFDGAVLEIKIGGGVFTDVVSAGGSFLSGGYDRALSTSFHNPLAGRLAWTGSSGGYKDTVLNLPAAAAGQTVQVRWRVGTDSSVAATGQRIDTLTLSDGFTCSGEAPLPLVAFSSAAYSVAEASASVTLTATLSAASSHTVTVAYATANGTALAGSDYVSASGTLTFTPGLASATFSVPLLDDAVVEGSETVTVTLSSPVSATLGSPSPAALTLLDDDQGLALAPASASLAARSGQAVTYTLTVTNATSLAGTFDVAFSGGTYTATVASTLGPLGPGASVPLLVVVHVPPGALPGDHSLSTLTVSRQGLPAHSAAASLDTLALVPAAYLPLVLR
jgi:hypothetical protein